MAENKIISYDVELLSTNKRFIYEVPEVFTNDLLTNEFQFNILDMTAQDLSGATGDILLTMRDGSHFKNEGQAVRSGSVFKYILKQNEGKHYGVAEIQLVVNISGKRYATPLYNFAVMQGLDDKIANEVVINDLNSETRKEINALKSAWQAVINETTGKDIVSAPEIIAARGSYQTLSQRLLATEQEKADKKNPVFQVKAKDGSELSENILSGSGWTLGAGWGGNFSNGFTHSAGSSDVLKVAIPNLGTKMYRVEITISPAGATGNGTQSDFWLSLGGSQEFETYKGIKDSLTLTYGIMSAGLNNDLIIRPFEQFAGTISNIKVQEVLKRSQPSVVIENEDRSYGLEFRTSTESTYIGLGSGGYSLDGEHNVSLGNLSMRNNTSGFWNTAVGYGALENNSLGSRNVAIGRYSLNKNTIGTRNVAIGSFSQTATTSGGDNVSVGTDALWRNTEGNYNTSIGTQSMASNTLGNYNIAIGNRALRLNETGNNNVALGNYALNQNNGNDNIGIGEQTLYFSLNGGSNVALGNRALNAALSSNNIGIGNRAATKLTTGESNIALGYMSLYKTTTGDNNLAIGYMSLHENTTGRDNIALGRFALEKNTSGFQNIAVGGNALSKNTTGNLNIGIGFNNSINNTSGADNISIGRQAMNALVSGTGNVAVGVNAMLEGSGNLEKNVAIGQSAGFRLSDGASNNVMIGYLAGRTSVGVSNNILIGHDVNAPMTTTSNYLNIGNAIRGDLTTKVISIEKLKLTNLATTKPAESGTVWNDGGVLKIS